MFGQNGCGSGDHVGLAAAPGRGDGAAKFITKPVDFDFLKTQLRDLSVAANPSAASNLEWAASKLSLVPT
jgi:hypothetical protein